MTKEPRKQQQRIEDGRFSIRVEPDVLEGLQEILASAPELRTVKITTLVTSIVTTFVEEGWVPPTTADGREAAKAWVRERVDGTL